MSLFVSVFIVATVLIAWTPQAKSTVCPATTEEWVESYESKAICGCASKFFGFIRNVDCNCWYECYCNETDYFYVTCEPDRCFRGETELVFKAFDGGKKKRGCEKPDCATECNTP